MNLHLINLIYPVFSAVAAEANIEFLDRWNLQTSTCFSVMKLEFK